MSMEHPDTRPDLDAIQAKTRELSKMICRTAAFENYTRSLETLKSMEEIYTRLNAFRKESMEMQLSAGADEYYNRMESLYRKYEDVLAEPVVHRFLSAEQQVLKIMRTVYDQLADRISLDMTHMNP